MKIACVLIAHLPVEAELRRHSSLRGKPVVITAESSMGRSVLDTSPGVKSVAVGMPVDEAVSRCRNATLLEADESYYREVFAKIIDGLLLRCPVVEIGGLGCAYIDVRESEAMYGGDAGVVSALLNSVPYGFNPRVGLAETRFPAYVAALISEDGQATKVPDEVDGFLRNHPIDLLSMPWDIRARPRADRPIQ